MNLGYEYKQGYDFGGAPLGVLSRALWILCQVSLFTPHSPSAERYLFYTLPGSW